VVIQFSSVHCQILIVVRGRYLINYLLRFRCDDEGMSMDSVDYGDALRDLMARADVSGAAALFEQMLASAPAPGCGDNDSREAWLRLAAEYLAWVEGKEGSHAA
jgi:hypothetical protein